MPPPPLRMPAPACSGQQFLAHHRRVASKPKARPLTSSAVPPRDAAALPSTRAAGGVVSMHAAYEEEDERVLQHAGEEELAYHCRLRPREGGAMVAVAAEAGRARAEPANRVRTQNLPSRP